MYKGELQYDAQITKRAKDMREPGTVLYLLATETINL